MLIVRNMDTNNLIYQIKDIIWNKKNTIEKYKGSKFSLQLQREINILEIATDTINNMTLSKILQKENEELREKLKEKEDDYNQLFTDYENLKAQFNYKDEADNARNDLYKNLSSWLTLKKKQSKET